MVCFRLDCPIDAPNPFPHREGDDVAHYDLIVIGSGPGGQKSAVQAAKLHKHVLIVERTAISVGGSCTHAGTIPSKAMREAVLYLSGFRLRGLYGKSYRVKQSITMEDLLFRGNQVIRQEIQVVQDQMTRNHVEIAFGTAAFMDPQRIKVTSPDGFHEHTADTFVIATGSTPARPPDIPFDDETIIDSDGLLIMKEIPSAITVVGAGVIGCEYACMLATLGTKVTLVDRRPRLLDFVDAEIIESLQYQMRQMRVSLRLGEAVDRVERDESGMILSHLKSGKQIASPTLLYSVGRLGATAVLNLPHIGIEPDARGRLKVNSNYQTSLPHIYAVGDVIGFPSLASTSMEQGRLASCYALHEKASPIPEQLLPYGIYTIPEISVIGPTEEDLTRDGIPYEVGVARYREIARGQIIGDENGMLKLLFHLNTRKLLAVSAIGEGATELIHIGQAVMAFEGTIDFLIANVFNYPTLAECYKVAALDGMNRLPRHLQCATESAS